MFLWRIFFFLHMFTFFQALLQFPVSLTALSYGERLLPSKQHFSPLQSMSMNNSAAQVESLSFQLQCGSLTWESIRWRMDNNTKAKVLWDGLIWWPLFPIHHDKKWERGDESNKESGAVFLNKIRMLYILSLICWIFKWKNKQVFGYYTSHEFEIYYNHRCSC